MGTNIFPCKLVAQLAFKAGGDVFHQIMCHKPKHLLTTSPAKIQACEIQQGDAGTNGSIILWKYTLDGKEHIAKQMIQDIDTVKKTVTYKWLEGDLLELYKFLLVTIHVETKGDIDFATWTIEYELRTPENPHPIALLNMVIELTTEIETHILG